MIGDDLYRDLKAIASRDPDGGEVQPTDADHARHKAWAIAAYGQETWDIYRRSNWDQPEV